MGRGAEFVGAEAVALQLPFCRPLYDFDIPRDLELKRADVFVLFEIVSAFVKAVFIPEVGPQDFVTCARQIKSDAATAQIAALGTDKNGNAERHVAKRREQPTLFLVHLAATRKSILVRQKSSAEISLLEQAVQGSAIHEKIDAESFCNECAATELLAGTMQKSDVQNIGHRVCLSGDVSQYSWLDRLVERDTK